MNDEYLVVHKSVLPDNFEKVIKTRELINENYSVSDACKEVGLSRSTYYKYKDFVFRPTSRYVKKAIMSLKLLDEKGVLSNILNFVAENKGNILAINQEMPIHNIAFVTITLDVVDMDISLSQLLDKLRDVKEVMDALLVAVE